MEPYLKACLLFLVISMANRFHSSEAKSRVAIIGAGIGGSSTAHFLFLVISMANRFHSSEAKSRVAIIGAGIGGSSTAHFLRRLRQDVEIVVYEKGPEVGGRMSTVDVAGHRLEAGAAILHPRNMYMKRFCEIAGLENATAEVESVGILDGEGYRPLQSPGSWYMMLYDLAQMLYQWGLDFFRLDAAVKALLDNFDNIYRVQDDGRYFTSVDGLFDAATPDGTFKRMLHADAFAYATEEWGLSPRTVKLLLGGFSHINYNQNLENLNAFVLAVTSAGVQDGLWAVKSGNYKVCESLLKQADVTLRHDSVQSIERLHRDTKLEYSISTASGQSDVFDAVVVATPLQYAGVEFANFEQLPEQALYGSYQRTVVTFVVGTPSKKPIGMEDKYFPEVLLVANDDYASISCMNLQPLDIFGESMKNASVWKMFSQESLDSSTLDALFSEREQVVVREFMAFPNYASVPRADLPGFVLDERVFYTSPIEWAASAMEMSALSGRNAALLVDSVLPRECLGDDDSLYSDPDQARACKKLNKQETESVAPPA